jgi:hypothetical protein
MDAFAAAQLGHGDFSPPFQHDANFFLGGKAASGGAFGFAD